MRTKLFTDPVVWTIVLLGIFGAVVWPDIHAGQIPGPEPDSLEYAFGAQALLHGQYVVDLNGVPHVPRYTPGFPLLLTPAVALGGPKAAVVVPFLAAVLLGALAAGIAGILGGRLAAPIAVVMVLGTVAGLSLSRVVMSDIPATLLALSEVALLALGSGVRSSIGAGILAGLLIWVRPATAVLLLAGLIGLTARPNWPRMALSYALAAVPLIVLLGLWQWQTFGSPWTTSYQAAGAGLGGGHDLASFFSVQWVFEQPLLRDGFRNGGAARLLQAPNAVLYSLQLTGFDFFLALPGVGLVGLISLVRLARAPGRAGALGRIGLTVLVLTLAVYFPYFYQSGRFLLIPAVLLNIAAAVVVARLVRTRLNPRIV